MTTIFIYSPLYCCRTMLSYFYNVFFSFSFIYFSTVALAKIKCLRFFKNILFQLLFMWKKVTWHTTKYGDPYSEFVLCIYPILCAHTPWTHTRSSGQPFMLRRPGSSPGSILNTSVVVLRMERVLYIHSPTDNSCQLETQTRNLWITSPTL